MEAVSPVSAYVEVDQFAHLVFQFHIRDPGNGRAVENSSAGLAST